YRWKPNSGVIVWGGCATRRATCGRSRRASKKRPKINGASDGPVSWKRRTDTLLLHLTTTSGQSRCRSPMLPPQHPRRGGGVEQPNTDVIQGTLDMLILKTLSLQ